MAPAPAPTNAPAVAPALAPAPAPSPSDDDPNHPFGFDDAWAIRVLQDLFNELNNYLVCLGIPPMNQPLMRNMAGYVYAIFRAAEVIRELP